jgi:hypothetical protein
MRRTGCNGNLLVRGVARKAPRLGSATINATVTPDSTPAGLTFAAVVTGSTVTVLVSGGTNNTKYRVDVPITLVESNARVAVAEFDVHVKDR